LNHCIEVKNAGNCSTGVNQTLYCVISISVGTKIAFYAKIMSAGLLAGAAVPDFWGTRLSPGPSAHLAQPMYLILL